MDPQPAFADLERAWAALAQETRATLAGITDWDRTLTRRIEQPDKTIMYTATKADAATQLLLHQVHHRAQAMAMLRQLGVEAQNLAMMAFAAKREEFRRTRRVAEPHALDGLRTDLPPHWMLPSMVVEVEYRQRLRDGLRHAALKGLNLEKKPELIRRSPLSNRGSF